MKKMNVKSSQMLQTMKLNLKRASIATVIAASMFSLAVIAQEGLYEKGQEQLDNENYRGAQDTFSALVKAGNAQQDAALYWLAYSQFKSRSDQEALKTIEQLVSSFPKSRWVDDAQALRVEIRDKRGESLDIDSEEMKLYALNALMNSPSDKSVATLTKLISGDSSDRVKRRALFVLSQINHPQAFGAIAELAKDDANTELQEHAIKVLGISGSSKAMELLSEIYQASNSQTAKLNVLHSYMIANRSDELVALAKSETDPELKRKSIRLVGAMSRPEALLEMYADASFKDHRGELLKAMAVGGGADALLSVISTEKDEALVVEAVKKMGIVSRKKAGKHLSEIYKTNKSGAVRGAVIQALFIQSNDTALVEIVKTETDPQLKRSALQKLSMMGSDEALDYFNEILNEG